MAKEIFKGFEKNLIDKTIFNRSRVQFAKKKNQLSGFTDRRLRWKI